MLTKYSFPLTHFFYATEHWKIRKTVFTQDFPLQTNRTLLKWDISSSSYVVHRIGKTPNEPSHA